MKKTVPTLVLVALLFTTMSNQLRAGGNTVADKSIGQLALTPTSQGVADFKEYDYYYNGTKWVPAWFQCDEAREVAIFSDEGKGKTYHYESFPKSNPSQKTVMSFRQKGDEDCGMMKCYFTLTSPGRSLVVFQSNYKDDDRVWTTGHSFVKSAGEAEIPGRDCRMMDRSRLAVITDRRSIYVSESEKGVLEYRSYNFNPASNKPSVMLKGGASSIDKSKEVETFTFQSGEYAYILNVSTNEQRPFVEVLVKKNGAVVQTEKSLSYNYLKKS
ncbi:MAG TPA: hypothetical protein VKB86_22175 [Pyrinomonadaceae bacterium]|nr:hypothetical protein [Pyrinomonadaceae bacterium]